MLSLDDRRPPVPPADLMLRVVPAFDVGDIEGTRWSFDVGGLRNLQLYEHALAAVSPWHFGGEVWLTDDRVVARRSFADFDRLLDFGCGCGRLLRHLGPVADQLEIHGADIDAEMIEWLRANISFGHFALTTPEPPLPYPDQHFDLVISHSVFTHVGETLQDAWLDELERVTRPGAVLLISVQGPSTWKRTREAAAQSGHPVDRWQDELESRGILFIADDAFVGSTHPDYYHSTIHAPWYVFDHWSGYFDIDGYLPDGAWAQDLVVLRRRDGRDGSSSPAIRCRQNAPPQTSAGAAGATDFANPLLARARRLTIALERARAAMSPAAGRELSDFHQLQREMQMLRAGLYEQGRRISVLGAQLREEIGALRREGGSD
jgi:SAM-dependent methyltransferase